MQSRRRKIVHSSLYDTARKSPATIRTRSWGFLPSESLFVSHFMSPSICILSLSQSNLNLDLDLDPTSTHLSMTSTLPSHTSSYAQARCTCTCQKKASDRAGDPVPPHFPLHLPELSNFKPLRPLCMTYGPTHPVSLGTSNANEDRYDDHCNRLDKLDGRRVSVHTAQRANKDRMKGPWVAKLDSYTGILKIHSFAFPLRFFSSFKVSVVFPS